MRGWIWLYRLTQEQPDRLEAIAAQQVIAIRAVTLALEDEAR